MRILLTGATGLIGQALRARLGATHEIVTLGRREGADIHADLSDPAAVAALDLPPIEALLHCAGVIDEDFRDDPQRAMTMAVFGAEALVARARASGAKRLAYVSSAHVYGPMVGTVNEVSPFNPVSNYAIAHFATEQVFRRFVDGEVAALALRPCAVFGDLADPDRFRRWSLIPFSFPREAALDHRITIRSTGEQRRNFVGTDDIAATLAAWLAAPPEGWSAINPLGTFTGTVFAFAELCAEIAQELTGKPCTVTRVRPEGPTMGDDYNYTSLSPLAHGKQDPRVVLTRLMTAALEE
ncbi:MAG: NAD(P)-dependent oxidoreductase [Cypionkella sp.]|uniref:NAD-dependent epimerase/dehydratase family protein n=1 Tax=Cypionkella sp. TaxID=2811411 RepID=UPI002ABD0DEF|nr:NAD(P)-dependent oxidoreductase [Cypionkella sp.]MDZ4309654.1 NAD(P)-dependent oxidoreductase [Cypionkella sp.]